MFVLFSPVAQAITRFLFSLSRAYSVPVHGISEEPRLSVLTIWDACMCLTLERCGVYAILSALASQAPANPQMYSDNFHWIFHTFHMLDPHFAYYIKIRKHDFVVLRT